MNISIFEKCGAKILNTWIDSTHRAEFSLGRFTFLERSADTIWYFFDRDGGREGADFSKKMAK